jgi:hypothetical protein
MMDRAAKLATYAESLVHDEGVFCDVLSADANRHITREALAYRAKRLGFSDLEISAAVDEALTAAGTTP